MISPRRRLTGRGRLGDSLQRGLQPVRRGVRIFRVAGHSPALPHKPHELKAGGALIVKLYPAVVIHGLADARAVLIHQRPVALLSATGAALYAGSLWWRAVIDRIRGEYADVAIWDILDCADASGLALGALRIGVRRIVLDPAAPGWAAVADVAASMGAEVLTMRPPALDMADRGAFRRLNAWLQVRTTPGDSSDGVS